MCAEFKGRQIHVSWKDFRWKMTEPSQLVTCKVKRLLSGACAQPVLQQSRAVKCVPVLCHWDAHHCPPTGSRFPVADVGEAESGEVIWGTHVMQLPQVPESTAPPSCAFPAGVAAASLSEFSARVMRTFHRHFTKPPSCTLRFHGARHPTVQSHHQHDRTLWFGF